MGPSTFLVILATVCLASAQLPRRLQIPGAAPVQPQDSRPLPYRRVLPAQQFAPAAKLRRPAPIAAPIRPVVEENSEEDDGPLSRDEVARLQNIPVAGPPPQQIRIAPPPQQVRLAPPQPQQVRLPPQSLREEEEEDEDDEPPQRQYAQPAPIQFRPAPQVRLQPQQVPVRQQQVQRQAAPARPRQPQAISDDEGRRQTRTRKPPVLILRKYREDNPDGSITWGYENDDGSFKEETIGTDCITRGKYGYVDPDGNRREYSYETGLRCDTPEEEELPLEPLNKPLPIKRPLQGGPARLQ